MTINFRDLAAGYDAPIVTASRRDDRPALPFATTRAIAAAAVALPIVALLLGTAGHQSAFPSVILAGVITAALAAAIRQAAGVTLPLARIAVATYALAAVLGAVVIASNQSNFGIPYTSSFDDSYYWINTESIATGGSFGAEHATLFEYVAAGYFLALSTLGAVAPADLLPLNWALSALALAAVLACSERLVGAPPPLGLALLATFGNAQFCLCVPHLYRDMLVTLGFTLAVLFAVRGRLGLALLGVGLALGTRTAHGFLAAFVLASVTLARTHTYRRHPRLIAAGLVIAVTAAALVVSRGSAAMLSGRGGESDSRDVASYALNRQDAVVEHLSEQSSLGAQVIGLGPVGIPLRMVSGYFAPVTLLSPVVERSYNTLMIPGRMGDSLKVKRFVAFMLVYWVTVLSWPLLAPGLLLGMRRLDRAGGTQRLLLRSLALCFLLIMVISMQERHRVPVLAFNPLLLAAFYATPATAEERFLARAIRRATLVGLGAVNLWIALRA